MIYCEKKKISEWIKWKNAIFIARNKKIAEATIDRKSNCRVQCVILTYCKCTSVQFIPIENKKKLFAKNSTFKRKNRKLQTYTHTAKEFIARKNVVAFWEFKGETKNQRQRVAEREKRKHKFLRNIARWIEIN